MKRSDWLFVFCTLLAPLIVANECIMEKHRSSRGSAIRVIRMDPNTHQLKLLTNDKKQRQTLRKFIDSNPGVIAAINGGFFMKSGKPSGFFKYHDWWSVSEKLRGVVGFNQSKNKQLINFDQLTVHREKIVSPRSRDPWWTKVEFVLGGAPLLIRDGQPVDTEKERLLPSFVRNRYARSGICLTDDQHILLVMASGGDRKSHALGYHKGLSLKEFTIELKQLGCQQALNLDGGYSSSMYFAGRVFPGHWLQDVWARPIANAIAILPVASH